MIGRLSVAFRIAGLFLILGSMVGCLSARMSDREPDRLFRSLQYDQAADHLKKGLADQGENGRDLLLYLLDVGLSLHSAGKYEESNTYFLKAEKIAEIKDYTSLSAEGATLLTSDNIKDYKGEDFEKVLINAYLALNFTLMGETEGALVEARKVNQKLYLMVSKGQRNYQQSAFARYLSAILYESEGRWPNANFNDAYIDYKKTREILPDYPDLGRDLWRTAYALKLDDDADRWKNEYKLSDPELAAEKKALSSKNGKGEVIVIFQNGLSPIKKPHPNWYSIPKFYPRYNPVEFATIEVINHKEGQSIRTHVLQDIESTAIQNLDDKWGGLLAKKMAGVVAKEMVGYQVEKMTGSPLLGLATKLIFYASDQADLRSWNLLPRDIQVARLWVEPGVQTIRLNPSGDPEPQEKVVQVTAGKKVFVNFRYMP